MTLYTLYRAISCVSYQPTYELFQNIPFKSSGFDNVFKKVWQPCICHVSQQCTQKGISMTVKMKQTFAGTFIIKKCIFAAQPHKYGHATFEGLGSRRHLFVRVKLFLSFFKLSTTPCRRIWECKYSSTHL